MKSRKNSHVSSDEVVALVNDAPRRDAQGDDVVASLHQCVAQRVTHVTHNP